MILHQHEADLRPGLTTLHPAGDEGLLVLHQVVGMLHHHLHPPDVLLDDQLRPLLVPVGVRLPSPGHLRRDVEELDGAGVVLGQDGVEEGLEDAVRGSAPPAQISQSLSTRTTLSTYPTSPSTTLHFISDPAWVRLQVLLQTQQLGAGLEFSILTWRRSLPGPDTE